MCWSQGKGLTETHEQRENWREMGLAEKVGQTLEEHAEEWGYSGVMGSPLEILSMGST